MSGNVSKITAAAEHNVHSQFGEDGILREIFARIGEGGRRACEFGAWDGKYCSNVAALIEQGWSALLIEADQKKYAELLENYRSNERVVTCCSLVESEGDGSLEMILERTGFGSDLDLLSIDIDGDDYWILERLKVRPRVICVEFNPTFGPWHEYRNPRGQSHGSSMAAFIRLAETLKYSVVYATYCNLFIVRDEDMLDLLPVTGGEVFKGGEGLTIVGSFFDGGNVALGPGVNNWTGVRNVRPVVPPSFLRAWPQSSWRILVQRVLYDGPWALIKRVVARMRRGYC